MSTAECQHHYQHHRLCDPLYCPGGISQFPDLLYYFSVYTSGTPHIPETIIKNKASFVSHFRLRHFTTVIKSN